VLFVGKETCSKVCFLRLKAFITPGRVCWRRTEVHGRAKQLGVDTMKIEVLFITPVRTAGHRSPDVVTYDDGPLVRALLKAGHAVLIDPPILEGYNEDEARPKNKPLTGVTKSNPSEGSKLDGENNDIPKPDKKPRKQSGSVSGPGEASDERSSKSKKSGAESDRELRQFVRNNQDDSERDSSLDPDLNGPTTTGDSRGNSGTLR
jgi:hypothetical protein